MERKKKVFLETLKTHKLEDEKLIKEYNSMCHLVGESPISLDDLYRVKPKKRKILEKKSIDSTANFSKSNHRKDKDIEEK